MPEKVNSKIDIHVPESTSQADVWAQFRQVERITVKLTQSYKYSLGKVSRFFLELENPALHGHALRVLRQGLCAAAPALPGLSGGHGLARIVRRRRPEDLLGLALFARQQR